MHAVILTQKNMTRADYKKRQSESKEKKQNASAAVKNQSGQQNYILCHVRKVSGKKDSFQEEDVAEELKQEQLSQD